MNRTLNALVVAGCVAPLLAGCATKGALRDAMAEQRTALETERTERMAADDRLDGDIETLQAELAELRRDLQALETDFDARIAAVEEGLQFALPVHFSYDEAMVRPQDMAALERFTEIINEHYAGAVVTVEGFADPAGSARYNMELSQRRADAVRDQLMSLGIQAQLRAQGYGEDRTVVPEAEKDEPGAELNRRVVFVVESPGTAAAITMLENGGL